MNTKQHRIDTKQHIDIVKKIMDVMMLLEVENKMIKKNDSFKNGLGNALLMWIVGVSPIILPVIYTVICYAINIDDKLSDIGMAVSTFLGGLLSIFVMKKEYQVDIKEYIRKPDTKTLILIIAGSIFYAITAMYIIYQPLLVGETEVNAFMIVELVVFSTLAPVGEELVFRFAMLTILLITAKNNRFKIMFSIVMISVLWMAMHLSEYVPRCFEITFVGIILGFIYLKSKNVIYCIVSHIVLNAVTYTFAALYHWFLEREYILYISILLFLVSGVALSYKLCKSDCGKFDTETNS